MKTDKPTSETAPEEEPPEALLGSTIRGRYRVESVIGSGGMGTVYRVIHTGIDKPMALKVLSRKMMQNANIVARFEREAKAAGNFGDPHVAAATDYGRTEDGRFYLVMEYIEGKELRDAIDEANGPLPPVRAFFIARQIATALTRAHKLGIVHRDLAPKNQ
jgi:serine/threonine-protein kinase